MFKQAIASCESVEKKIMETITQAHTWIFKFFSWFTVMKKKFTIKAVFKCVLVLRA